MVASAETAPATVAFTFDGTVFRGRAGQPLALALLEAGRRGIRPAGSGGGLRGAFCMMGICQDCVVLVNGRRTESCRLPVYEGLVAEAAP